MTTFIVRRFIQGFFVLLFATFAIYTILLVTPGGVASQVAELKQSVGGGRTVSGAYIAQLEHLYKLDRSIKPPFTYLLWLFDPDETTEVVGTDEVQKGVNFWIGPIHIQGSGVITGDLGRSLTVSKASPVLKMMGDRIGYTLALTITSLLLSILIAFPIGILSAIRQYSRLDYTVTGFSFVGLSMPTFWFGLMLALFLGVLAKQFHDAGHPWMPYLPVAYIADTDQDGNVWNRIYHLILPVTVLSFVSIAGYSRYIRSSMLEVLRQDYVRTAWAKGLTQRGVILKHALRNALIPVITVVTLSLPGLFSGAIATETVFAYAGMGQLYAKSVFALDIPLVMGFLLIITTLIIISNILADVLYAFADPRIRYS